MPKRKIIGTGPNGETIIERNEDDFGEYRVERILGTREIEGRFREYLVKFEQFEDLEWLPVKNLTHCKDLIDDFKNELGCTSLPRTVGYIRFLPPDNSAPQTQRMSANTPQAEIPSTLAPKRDTPSAQPAATPSVPSASTNPTPQGSIPEEPAHMRRVMHDVKPDISRPPKPKSMKIEAVDAADSYYLPTPEHEAPLPPPSKGKSVCQLAEDFLILFTSVEARYHAIIEYVLRLRYKRSVEEREKLKDRLETILVDGVPVSHFQKKPDCNMDVLEAYVDVCNGGFTVIQQDLAGLMSVFEAHAVQAQVIRANEVFTATVVGNVRDFCRKLKAVNFPIVEDMLEAMLRCLFKNVYGPKEFVKLRLGTVELIRREFAEFCAPIA